MKKTTSISLRNKFLNSTALLAATIALAFAAQSNTAKAACSITTDNGVAGLSDGDVVECLGVNSAFDNNFNNLTVTVGAGANLSRVDSTNATLNVGNNATITNNGTILSGSDTLTGNRIGVDFEEGIVTNNGIITVESPTSSAIGIYSERQDDSTDSVTINNGVNGVISATGAIATGIFSDADRASSGLITLNNLGAINVNGSFASMGIQSQEYRSTGSSMNVTNGGTISLTTDQSGVIYGIDSLIGGGNLNVVNSNRLTLNMLAEDSGIATGIRTRVETSLVDGLNSVTNSGYITINAGDNIVTNAILANGDNDSISSTDEGSISPLTSAAGNSNVEILNSGNITINGGKNSFGLHGTIDLHDYYQVPHVNIDINNSETGIININSDGGTAISASSSISGFNVGNIGNVEPLINIIEENVFVSSGLATIYNAGDLLSIGDNTIGIGVGRKVEASSSTINFTHREFFNFNITNAAMGTISFSGYEGAGIVAYGSGDITNEGSILSTVGSSGDLVGIYAEAIEEADIITPVDSIETPSLTITNSGIITLSSITEISMTDSGDITPLGISPSEVAGISAIGLTANNSLVLANSNTGAITINADTTAIGIFANVDENLFAVTSIEEALSSPSIADISITNAGSINTTSHDLTDSDADGILAFSAGSGGIEIDNSGSINSSAETARGITATSSGSGTVDINNSGTINAEGNNAAGIYAATNETISAGAIGITPLTSEPSESLSVTNSGTITVSSTEMIAPAVSPTSEIEENYIHGVSFVAPDAISEESDGDISPLISIGTLASFTNTNTGVVTASKGYHALFADGDIDLTVTNNGTLTGDVGVSGGAELDITLGDGSITNGTWEASLAGDDSLSLTGTSSNTLSNSFTGFDDFAKTGTGTWDITNNLDFSDNVHIGAGTLAVTQRAGGNTVLSGDNLTMDAASTLFVTLNDSDTPALQLDGTATQDGTLQVAYTDAVNTALTTQFTVLTAGDFGGSVFDTVDTGIENTPFRTATVMYSSTSTVIDVIQNSFSTGATDPNSKAFGDFLDDLAATPNADDFADLFEAVNNSDNGAEAAKVFAEIIPDTGLDIEMIDYNGAFIQTIMQYLTTGGGGGGIASNMSFNGLQLAFADDDYHQLAQSGMTGDDTSTNSDTHGIWARGFAVLGDVDNDGLISGYDYHTGGLMVGYDYGFNDDIRVGATVGLARSNADIDASADETDVDSYNASLYANYNPSTSPIYIDGVLSFSYNSFEAERNFVVGATPFRAESDFDGFEISAYGEIGSRYDYNGVIIQPLIAAHLRHNETESYVETGASPFNLTVNDANHDVLRLATGLRLATDITSDNLTIQPELRGRIAYDVGDTSAATSASLGGSTSSFAVTGVDRSRVTGILGAGATISFEENLSLFVDYDAELNADVKSHTLSGGFRYSW